MKKKIILSSVVAASLLTLVGCGGGGSASTTSTGKAYYWDAPVAGVNYKCGSQEGVTDENGTFVYEKGKTCEFYLGDVKLKDLDSKNLVDGEVIVENNVTIATILQTLDVDGNLSNGIKITPKEVEVVAPLIKTLPKDESEAATLVQTVAQTLKSKIPEYKGHPITPEVAKQHLEKTQKIASEKNTERLLAGKTFYVVGVEEDGNVWYDKATFDNNLSSLQWIGLAGGYKGKSGKESIKLDGNKIIWLEDNSYTVVGPIKDGYIELTDYEADGSVESHTRLYFDKSKADTYYQSLSSGGSGNFKFTTDYLNGKTFYYVKYDDFGYDDIGVKWNMARIHFNKDTFTWTEYNTPDSGTTTFHYKVDTDGTIEYWSDDSSEEAGKGSIYNPKLEDDRIEVCVNDEGSVDCNTYLFFDEAEAKEFVDQHNSGSTDDKGNEDYVSHGKTTGVVTYHPDVAQIDKVEFDTSTDELKIYFNQPMTWGSHTMTTGDYVPDNKNSGFGSDGKLYIMKLESYKPKGVINFSAGYFKSQKDGQETKAFSITFPE